MHKLKDLYNPITATPFNSDSAYIEVEPCQSLRPYIKCFWGTKAPVTRLKEDTLTNELVIPDTCMDIIFDVNYSENSIDSHFYGINNEAFMAGSPNDREETTSTFAIRFYAWTAVLFSDESMTGIRNKVLDAQQHYSKIKYAIEPLLFDKSTLRERIEIAEKVLIDQLNLKRVNHHLGNALFCMLRNRGNMKMTALADEVFMSRRQLERIFNEYIGISPKQLASLVRYQNLWNDILFNKYFRIGDAVQLYGYTDQSHLLHEFKKYHTVLPSEAKQYALSNTTK